MNNFKTSNRHLVSVLLNRDLESASKSEIRNLKHHSLAVHQKIVRLKIPVDDSAAMAKGHAFTQLKHQTLQIPSSNTQSRKIQFDKPLKN